MEHGIHDSSDCLEGLSCTSIMFRLETPSSHWVLQSGREERREQEANLCFAFLTGMFLGHVFFNTSPSNSCVSAQDKILCRPDLTCFMSLVLSLTLLGLGRGPNHIIPSSGWPALLPYWSTAALTPFSMSRRDLLGSPLRPTPVAAAQTHWHLQRCGGGGCTDLVNVCECGDKMRCSN